MSVKYKGQNNILSDTEDFFSFSDLYMFVGNMGQNNIFSWNLNEILLELHAK